MRIGLFNRELIHPPMGHENPSAGLAGLRSALPRYVWSEENRLIVLTVETAHGPSSQITILSST